MSGRARLLVPWAPGPLVDPDAQSERDVLDELVDELFPDVDGGPGLADAALVLAGIALLAWALATDQGRGWLIAGGAALVLGLILPGRSAIRRLRVLRGAGRDKLILDATDAHVLRLVSSYDELLVVAAGSGVTRERARDAAHRAVVETASLLRGRAPEVAAEHDYVLARAEAVEALIEVLRQQPSVADEASTLTAIAQAKSGLDAVSEIGALRSIESLRRELEGSPGSDD